MTDNLSIARIYDLLYRLGITARYIGFFHASYAVYLAVHQPERLLLVTKWLYPEVATHYHTTWQCVERNIRTVSALAWQSQRSWLETLAGRPLTTRPTPTAFLTILANYFTSNRVA